jgi:pimeloyl-ACP methyl ester carboxylesterase
MHLIGLALAIVALVIAAGLAYQQLGFWRDRLRWPAQGAIIDIGDGLRLHFCAAGQGLPTVILESGIAATTLNWRALQEGIAQFTRVVSYDRAGLGFSDPPRTPRTPSHIVAELRALLRKAGIPPPYVLVGHSFGGLVMRRFALEYPEETRALILLDALRPEDWTPLSEGKRLLLARGVKLLSRGALLARFGIVRLCLRALMAGSRFLPRAIGRAASGHGVFVMDRIAGEIGKMPREVWPVIAAHWSSPASFHGLAAHLRDLPAGIAEIAATPTLQGIPVIVITAGREPRVDETAIRAVSADAQHIVSPASGHWVHLDDPELVLRVIREAVTDSKAN